MGATTGGPATGPSRWTWIALLIGVNLGLGRGVRSGLWVMNARLREPPAQSVEAAPPEDDEVACRLKAPFGTGFRGQDRDRIESGREWRTSVTVLGGEPRRALSGAYGTRWRHEAPTAFGGQGCEQAGDARRVISGAVENEQQARRAFGGFDRGSGGDGLVQTRP